MDLIVTTPGSLSPGDFDLDNDGKQDLLVRFPNNGLMVHGNGRPELPAAGKSQHFAFLLALLAAIKQYAPYLCGGGRILA